jgi:nicotinamidase-related amidase
VERVWDRFLTTADKASLRERAPQVWGFGERPALVLVDLYRWVFGDREAPLHEAVKEWPGSCGPAAWRALPHIVRLLEAARAARIPIAHVCEIASSSTGVRGWAEQPNRMRGAAQLADPLIRARYERRFEIVDEVAPLPGEAVIDKEAPSGFFGTLLPAFLHGRGVDAVILAGESTSGCVRATCVDGRSHRYRMTVVEECVFDRQEAPHALNLFDMHQKYADVLGVDEVVAHLESLHRT